MKKFMFIALAMALMTIGSCAENNAKNNEALEVNDTIVFDTCIVKTLPKGLPVEDILKTIVDDYKGQVVVIDFWATWCPPCMAAMEQIDPIKEKYFKAGSPVAFVYITGETSPIEKWKTTIPGIKGYHYRLTDKEFNGLLRHMGIRGIPTYYIATKKGVRSYDNIAEGGYPGDDVITAKIEEALSK